MNDLDREDHPVWIVLRFAFVGGIAFMVGMFLLRALY